MEEQQCQVEFILGKEQHQIRKSNSHHEINKVNFSYFYEDMTFALEEAPVDTNFEYEEIKESQKNQSVYA